MATKTNNEVATVETVGFSNIARLTDLKSELMECCVGMEFSMDRIKMPSGVSKFFTVPADSEEEQQVSEIVGIILHSHPSFAYYTTTYQGGSNPPDCGSLDGKQGVGNPGGDCRKCPHNRFGSGTEGGQGKACQNRKMLYILQDEGISGTNTKKRDGFNQMIEDAHAGKIDLIITKSVSRFARNTGDSLQNVRKLKENGVEIYFEKENIWTFDTRGDVLCVKMIQRKFPLRDANPQSTRAFRGFLLWKLFDF